LASFIYLLIYLSVIAKSIWLLMMWLTLLCLRVHSSSGSWQANVSNSMQFNDPKRFLALGLVRCTE